MSRLDETAGYRDAITDTRDGQASAGAAQVPPASVPELQSLLSIVIGALIIAALYLGQKVLIPITLAVMLSFVLSPVVAGLQRLRLWRAPAVIIAVLAALGLLGTVAALIGSQAAALADDAPRYARRIESKIESVQAFTGARLASLSRTFGGIHPERAVPAAATTPGRRDEYGGLRPIAVRVVPERTSPFTIARTILAPVLAPLETTVIVLIVAIFILMQREDLRDRFIRLFGSNDLHRTTRAMDDAGKRLSRYFVSQLAVNTCFGIVIGAGLWLIGIPSPAMWGVLAGMLRFVPYIGALLAAVAPAVLAAAIDPGWAMALEVVALFVIAEPLTGYVVEPLLYGRSTGLSPVSVIVSAIFWTWLWGAIGLVMSTPLTLILVVMGRHVKSLEFFDVLLGDRPALTPVESFYQRVLAKNSDEALAQAETLLADRPLLDYYDDVVLPGLKLALEDRARGSIDPVREREIARTVRSVIADLSDHETAADEVTIDGTVACVAGHDPLDHAVTAMLMQLMANRDIPVRAIGHAATSREAIGTLDLDGVAIVMISYLELAGSPAHLRYLVRRLRSRAPEARIVVGFWPREEAVLTNAATQHAIGADRYVTSFAAALDAIVEEGQAAAVPAASARPPRERARAIEGGPAHPAASSPGETG